MIEDTVQVGKDAGEGRAEVGDTVSTDHGEEPGVERVVVLGAGLIGTSIALALRSHEVDVVLSDPDPATLRMAVDLGAGRPLKDRSEERRVGRRCRRGRA